jgi:uncharacterized protein Yka (UPF0111/DUF47 family)
LKLRFGSVEALHEEIERLEARVDELEGKDRKQLKHASTQTDGGSVPGFTVMYNICLPQSIRLVN